MSLSILSLINSSNQTFESTLPVDSQNRRFHFEFSWNPIANYWQFDLYDINDSNKLLVNKQPIYLIDTPYNNIIASYTYKEIGSLYVINISGKNLDKPNYDNISDDFVLVWGDTPND